MANNFKNLKRIEHKKGITGFPTVAQEVVNIDIGKHNFIGSYNFYSKPAKNSIGVLKAFSDGENNNVAWTPNVGSGTTYDSTFANGSVEPPPTYTPYCYEDCNVFMQCEYKWSCWCDLNCNHNCDCFEQGCPCEIECDNVYECLYETTCRFTCD